jgi:tetratricopeptide (TPR) repeat protein/tRNA A-37 threonylcarbamoyl transferase component Bud32
MPAPLADRNLLFGILALQNGFIGRTALIEAMHAWVAAKHRPIGEILVESGALLPEHRHLLETLLDAHVSRHGGEANSLASLSASSPALHALKAVGDPDIEASVNAATTGTARGEPPTTGPENRPGARRFRILRPHARGGLGEVFVAHDDELNRQVALKEIQEAHADQQESRGRFLLEAEITGGLEHPGVVPVYGLGSYDDGRPYYAMRFIQGDSLRDAIGHFHDPAVRMTESERALALRGLLGRFVDVCQAVAYAHSRGVLHRDLKPGNVMLGKYGETLVVDWGLAKVVGREEEAGEATIRPTLSGDSALTQTGRMLGTAAYMSPEQAEGRLDLMGPASDVYSLGATLYCLLTGQPPFTRGELPDVLEQVRRGGFQRPRQVKPSTPPALEAVCLKAMALKPADRYGSAEELAAEVEHWLADEPVKAYREPMAARASRWMRKHPAAVAVMAAVLLLAAPLAGALAWVSDGARRRAEEDRLRIEGEQKATEEQRAKAARLAEHNERLAERHKKVGAFYEKYVLSASRPFGGGQAFDVTLKQALDEAAPHIRTGFAGSPDDEASVSLTLGETYLWLGEFTRAEALFRRAEDLARQAYGERSGARLEASGLIAAALLARNRFRDAGAILESGTREAAGLLGKNHKLTLTFRHNHAMLHLSAGRLGEAESLARDVARTRLALLGPVDADTVASQHLLAAVLAANGKPAEAVHIHRSILGILRVISGPDHPHTLTCEHNLAEALGQAGEVSKAVRALKAVIKSRRSVCGPEHIDTLMSEGLRATLLGHQRLFREADTSLRACVAAFEKKLGPDHQLTLTSRSNRSLILIQWGKLPEAEKEIRQVLARRLDVLGRENPDTIASQNAFAMLASIRKTPAMLDEAEKICAAALPVAEKIGGDRHPMTFNMIANNVGVLLARNKYREALPLIWKASGRGLLKAELPQIFFSMRLAQLTKPPADPRIGWETGLLAAWSQMEGGRHPAAEKEIRAFLGSKAFTADDWQLHAAMSLLGDCLLRQKKYADAEPPLLAGHEGLTKTKGCPPERIAEARARLARLYTEWGKPDKAAAWGAP